MTLPDLEMHFTPEDLGHAVDSVRLLRHTLLANMDEGGADPSAGQHYLMALGFLEQAQRSLILAQLTQSRALAMDNSAVFNLAMLDEVHAQEFDASLPWIFDCNDGYTAFATENEACAAQRNYRVTHGFHALTGESNVDSK